MTSITRSHKTALLILGCVLSFLVVHLPALSAADAAASAPTAEKAPVLPVTATFEKGADTETGPYSVKLKNDSKETITVSAKVLLAVAFHAESKARQVPDHVIVAGEVVSIPGLAAGDKVVLMAKGYAPLTLTVK